MANGDNVTTQISREAPFLEDYRRRLMDSVFAATDQPIVPQERAISPFDEFQTAGFGEAARQLGFTFDPATGSLTRTGQAAFQPDLDAARAAAQAGIPALQAAQDPVAQMKQAELQIKAQEVQRKAKKDADDLAVRKAELQLKAAKDKEQLKINKAEIMIDAQKENVKLATDKQDKTDKRNLEILKTMK